MSKRNKPWWKEKKKVEVLELVDFIRLKAANQIYRRDAQAFYDYFVRNGYFTPYMKTRIRELAKFACPEKLNQPKHKPKWGKDWHRKTDVKRSEYYLYAISDGEFIKIGFSNDPKRRVKDLQTGRARPLKLVWQTLCAYSDIDARRQERKLHRRLKAHKVRGEWFEFDCLLICRKWRVMGLEEAKRSFLNYASKDQIDKELDLQMLEQIYKNEIRL